MSRRGNCWDNAVAESFFSSLKKERIKRRIYSTREEARSDIFDYIEVFYNRRRRHSRLCQLSLANYEEKERLNEAVECISNCGKFTYPVTAIKPSKIRLFSVHDDSR